MRRIYAGSAIEKRHSVIADYGRDPADYSFFPPAKSLKPEPTTEERNDLFIREANRLSAVAVEDLFARLGKKDTHDITHLITISCTGFSAPGFDFHLARELELPAATRRYHIGFMGCYAALTGMSLAHSICKAEPGARVPDGERGALFRSFSAAGRSGYHGCQCHICRRGLPRR